MNITSRSLHTSSGIPHSLLLSDFLSLVRLFLHKHLTNPITKIYEVFESCAGKPFDAYISTKVVEDRKQGDKALMDKQTLLQHLKDNPNTPQVSVASIIRVNTVWSGGTTSRLRYRHVGWVSIILLSRVQCMTNLNTRWALQIWTLNDI